MSRRMAIIFAKWIINARVFVRKMSLVFGKALQQVE